MPCLSLWHVAPLSSCISCSSLPWHLFLFLSFLPPYGELPWCCAPPCDSALHLISAVLAPSPNPTSSEGMHPAACLFPGSYQRPLVPLASKPLSELLGFD